MEMLGENKIEEKKDEMRQKIFKFMMLVYFTSVIRSFDRKP